MVIRPSKFFERILYIRLYNFLEDNLLFTNKQFGFRRKHSTVDAMVEFIERIRTCTNKLIISFFLDLKKACDTIDHQILLHKIECYGIRGNCHKWFASYLSNRYQRVQVNGCLSN